MNNSPHNIDIKVGANIRSLRLRTGMSQEALAEKLGVAFQQVQKYEKRMNRVSASRLLMVSQAFGCQVGDLFDGTENVSLSLSAASPVPHVAPQSRASAQAGQLLDVIPRRQRTAVLSLLRAIAASEPTADDDGEFCD